MKRRVVVSIGFMADKMCRWPTRTNSVIKVIKTPINEIGTSHYFDKVDKQLFLSYFLHTNVECIDAIEYFLDFSGKHGFILPADQIIPNSLEVLDSLQGMVEEARALGYL